MSGVPPLRLPPRKPLFVGVVHLAPLPGSPGYEGSMPTVLALASRDAAALAEGGVDALLLENFGDVPFHAERVPPETVAAMARALEVVRRHGLPIGVNVLRNDARAAVGLCAAGCASFLRVNVHVGSVVSDQGLLTGRAAETCRELRRLAPEARLLADVQVKHAAPLAARPLEEEAREAVERGLADAVLVTGAATGRSPLAADVERAAGAVGRERVWIGSGLDAENAATLLRQASGAIVGTALKEAGDVRRPVDVERVRRLRHAIERAWSS